MPVEPSASACADLVLAQKKQGASGALREKLAMVIASGFSMVAGATGTARYPDVLDQILNMLRWWCGQL